MSEVSSCRCDGWSGAGGIGRCILGRRKPQCEPAGAQFGEVQSLSSHYDYGEDLL